MYPRSYPALSFCFVLEGCRLADAREGRGEVAVEGPGVGAWISAEAGTRSRLGFQLCLWNVRRESKAASLRLLRVSSLLGSDGDVKGS